MSATPPRILIARLNHETNTFSPVPTPLQAFAPAWGDEARAAHQGMRTAMAAFLDLAQAIGARIVTPVSAAANPSGCVAAAAYTQLCDCIIEAAEGCDALLLDLHGAMVAENSDDGEGDLLEALRQRHPAVPIGVALDLHANLTPKMVRNADVIVGFKTYPHVDMYETGAHAGRLLLDLLQGRRARIHMAWRPLPLLAHTMRSATFVEPMQAGIAQARAAEAQGALAVSVFAGFCLSNIEAPCVAVVALSAQSQAHAQSLADAVARPLWAGRDGFFYRSPPLAESLAQARALAEGASRPVLLLDHGDNCMSGGPCDVMEVLREALALGLSEIAMGPLCDPQAVDELIRAGEGAQLTVALGNKVPDQRLPVPRAPLRLSGTVRRISDGQYTVTGPTYTGQRMGMGRTVLFDAGAARIVVTEQPHEPWDLGVFSCVGLQPQQQRYLLLKSKMYCRPVFEPLAAGLVECDSGGVTGADLSRFAFTRLRRPVAPLDAGVEAGF